MKKTLVLALLSLVAMLAVPTVVGSPENNPNGNPVVSVSSMITTNPMFGPVTDGPGFSEVGQYIAFDNIYGFKGVSDRAPGHMP